MLFFTYAFTTCNLLLRKSKSSASALLISDFITAEISVFNERRISNFRDSVSIFAVVDPGKDVFAGVAAAVWLEVVSGLLFAEPVYLNLRRFLAIHSNEGRHSASEILSEQIGRCYNVHRVD